MSATTELAPIEPTNKRERELRDRAVRDYAALQASLLDTGVMFFAPGTEATVARKAGTVAKYRRKHEQLPLAHDGLDQLVQRVLDEDRQDLAVMFGGYASAQQDGTKVLVPAVLGGWSAYERGARGESLDLAPTERAFQQLLSKRPIGHPAPSPDVGAWRTDVEPHEVVLRHRKLPAERQRAYASEARECYAMVSPSYQPYDLNEAASDLRKVVPHDARTRVRYDGQRATVDVILQNPYYLDGGDAASVGETHRVVLRMRTADDGSGGYHLSLLAERVRCINLTLLHSKRSLFHGTHRQEGLRDLAEQALAAVEPTMEQFAQTWRATWQEYWVDKHTKGNLTGEEALTRIVGHGKYRIPGLGAEGTLEACLQALATEPGDSRAHVHNAMTAAAHRSPGTWATRWADEECEEQASSLLYQSVRWLPEYEAAAS
jgi:hypothetical protein